MSDDAPEFEFTITKNVSADRDTVWRLWTEPSELARWFHPHGTQTLESSVSAEVRVGGRYAYTMVNEESGEEFPTGGTYLEVERPARLVFTWGHPDRDDQPVATVTLEEHGDTTEVRFTLRGLPGAGEDIERGWVEALDNLEAAAR